MIGLRSFPALACVGALLAGSTLWLATNARAQLVVSDPIVYRLRAESALLRGCFAPCECPIQIADDLRGSFVLQRAPSIPPDPFAAYTVSNLIFWVKLGTQTVRITGSGVYRIGGEVALTHRLTLELQFGDQAPEKFDSGVQPGGGEFPLIDIDVSMNEQICFDTVIQVRAEPALPDDADGDSVPDDLDNCRSWFNPDQNDRDGNGIGGECECGDQTEDGQVNVLDILGINSAILGMVPVSQLCDTNNDGLCNVSDIIGANQKIFGRPAYCSRFPPPGL